MLIVAIIFLRMFFINTPYGRDTSRSWGRLVNAEFMWLAMEFPAAVFHFLSWATRKESGLPIHIFVPRFEMHDLHGSIIFSTLNVVVRHPDSDGRWSGGHLCRFSRWLRAQLVCRNAARLV
jgi:hypothetical protein